MATSAPSQPTSDSRSEIGRSSRRRPRDAERRRGSRVRRPLLLVPVLAVTVGLGAACAEDAGPSVPNLPPIPTALPSALPTSIPTSLPTQVPTGEPQGTALGYDGALLQPLDQPVKTSAGQNASCNDIVDSGWVVDDCGA